jgi:hypothetical protein
MLFSLSGRDIVTEKGREAAGRGHRNEPARDAHGCARVSATRHLSCDSCRVRLPAGAPEVDLLDGMCPLCGVTLRPASRVADVLGFALFDVGLPADLESCRRSGAKRALGERDP